MNALHGSPSVTQTNNLRDPYDAFTVTS